MDIRDKLPKDFTDYTRGLMGEALFSRFVNAFSQDVPTSIRINRRKCSEAELADLVGDGERVGWCDDGYYLPTRPAFTFDPRLHAGWYYVQEASSMFLSRVLRQLVSEPVAMLDMCAAPGGKSTTAIAALPEGSRLVCNEPIRTRANILAENIQKWGVGNVMVTNNYPKDIARAKMMFDVILCDVPCSGEGMFRKDEAAIGEWSMQKVNQCASLQREIVAEAWKCLKDGGILVYSTCTFNAHEDEENVDWICRELGAEPIEIETREGENILGSLVEGIDLPVYRFIPGVARGEGLFMAVMRKGDNSHSQDEEFSGKPRVEGFSSKTKEEKSAGKKTFSKKKGDSRLNVIYDGIPEGERKGKDIIPPHALALSVDFDAKSYPIVEVDLHTAISYLRREAIVLPEDAPRGFVAIAHRGARLGFAKNIGNRANNLYPQEWRIRTSHV